MKFRIINKFKLSKFKMVQVFVNSGGFNVLTLSTAAFLRLEIRV